MSYRGSIARIEKVARFVLVVVTLVLAGFLIALGTKVLGDLDAWVVAPSQEAFQDQAARAAAQQTLSECERRMEGLLATKAVYQKSLDKAQNQNEAQKESFDHWLEARAAIGSSQEDGEVRGRAKALDQFRMIQESWQARIDDVEAKAVEPGRQVAQAQEKVRQLEAEASQRYDTALRAYAMRLFLLRLGLALPILALGVFLFVRFRKARFWPMVWGYGIFSLYVFFVGLVPYLPSFGGYIRLVVGVVLAMFTAFYVIRQLQRYLQKKREELAASTQDRAARIQDELALRAFQSHSCPSCERDFLNQKWYPKVRTATEIRTTEEAPDFCCFCGLPLFGACRKCGHKNFLHFPFCGSCGSGIGEEDPAV